MNTGVLKSRNRSEAHEELIREILLRYGADPFWRIWKNPTGAAYRNGRAIHYGLKGSADIIGITSQGIFVALEVKTGQARQTKEQKAFEAMVLKMNGIYRVIRRIEDVLAVIK